MYCIKYTHHTISPFLDKGLLPSMPRRTVLSRLHPPTSHVNREGTLLRCLVCGHRTGTLIPLQRLSVLRVPCTNSESYRSVILVLQRISSFQILARRETLGIAHSIADFELVYMTTSSDHVSVS